MYLFSSFCSQINIIIQWLFCCPVIVHIQMGPTAAAVAAVRQGNCLGNVVVRRCSWQILKGHHTSSTSPLHGELLPSYLPTYLSIIYDHHEGLLQFRIRTGKYPSGDLLKYMIYGHMVCKANTSGALCHHHYHHLLTISSPCRTTTI